MQNMLVWMLLVIGITCLIKGAALFVEGASVIAQKRGISEIVIGLTIVAFGTSAPELFVNVTSAWSGHVNLALGNILGSNIANILLICGLAVFSGKLSVSKDNEQTVLVSLIFGVVLGLLALSPLDAYGNVGVGGGFILFVGSLFYVYYVYRSVPKERILPEFRSFHVPISTYLWTLGGCVLLWIGSSLTVTQAVEIAQLYGLSERVIGLTIVALGTSLPELVTMIVAINKGHMDIGLGDLIGSNIANISRNGGLVALIHPLVFDASSYIDLLVFLLATIVFSGLIYFNQGSILKRRQGVFLLVGYVGYMVWIAS